MKVVLSRKGFDSSFGGYPNLILPNNEIVMLPIPSIDDTYKYSDIHIKNGVSLYNIMKSLKRNIFFEKILN